ncbi:MAG: hypothetical protein K1W35_12925 [Lachnospiraceae bacterium]
MNNINDVIWYRNFDTVQYHVYYKLLNGNIKGILKDAIYDEYLDLVKVYYVYFKNREMFADGEII